MSSFVDPATHARFLVYLETWPYFRDPGTTKLKSAEFVRLDRELQALEARVGRLSPEERARRQELRRTLMIE